MSDAEVIRQERDEALELKSLLARLTSMVRSNRAKTFAGLLESLDEQERSSLAYHVAFHVDQPRMVELVQDPDHSTPEQWVRIILDYEQGSHRLTPQSLINILQAVTSRIAGIAMACDYKLLLHGVVE